MECHFTAYSVQEPPNCTKFYPLTDRHTCTYAVESHTTGSCLEFLRYTAVHVETERWYLLYLFFSDKKKKEQLNAKENNPSIHILSFIKQQS